MDSETLKKAMADAVKEINSVKDRYPDDRTRQWQKKIHDEENAVKTRQEEALAALRVERILAPLPLKLALAIARDDGKCAVMELDPNKDMSERMRTKNLNPNNHPSDLRGAAATIFKTVKDAGRKVFFRSEWNGQDGLGFASVAVMYIEAR